VSFSHTPSGRDVDIDCTIGECLPGSDIDDPAVHVVSTQELQSLVDHMTTQLSPLEAESLTGYLEGLSYEQIAEKAGCDPKTVDNALQRVKRKVGQHIERRRVVD
jgi:RNA polymerase sporulation-specific sigma factor